jgi:hypothetical protein
MCSSQTSGSLSLGLSLRADNLSATVINLTSHVQNIWDLQTYWGWSSLSIQVRAEAEKPVHIKRRWRDWTKNGPVYFVLLPNGKRDVVLDLHDGWWDIHAVSEWNDRLVSLRALLQIESTPESERFGVFTGSVYSDWICSAPPHSWLFAAGDAKR